jgi:hypothetical protein
MNTEQKIKFLESINNQIKKNRYLHNRSSEYYGQLHNYIFLPSVFITGISTIFAFLSTSQFIDIEEQSIFAIIVGVLSSISTVLQSLSGAYKFSNKSELHRNAAEEFNNLQIKVKFEKDKEENNKEFLNNLEIELLDITKKCKYLPPQFIIASWYTSPQYEHLSKFKKETSKYEENLQTSINVINSNIDPNSSNL